MMPSRANPPTRRWLLPVAAIAVVLLLLGLLAPRLWLEPEPRFENRSVTEWSLDLLSPLALVRSNATVSLRAIGPIAIPPLVRQLERGDSLLKQPYIALAPRLPVSWRRKFRSTVRPFQASEGRLAAAMALSLYAPHVPVEPLLRRLRDVDKAVAAQAANTLAAIGPASLPGLMQAADDPTPWVRAMACQALSKLGPTAAPAAEVLARRLGDGELQIAEQAAHVLLRMGAPAVPHLTSALTSPDPRSRYHAARSLGSMGRPARSAVPALLVAAADSDPSVQREARNALRILAPDLVIEEAAPAQN
jgi:HEAT repeat protein